MRKINVVSFITLDGVLQAPGGPEEDRSGNFKWGGWTVNYSDNMTNNHLTGVMSQPFDLLLGRRTYEIFAAYWPYIKNDPIADKFNSIHKYVVSSQQRKLNWDKSVLLTGDIPRAIKKLKEEDGPDLLVHGSGKLVQTLLSNQLIDTLDVWTYPVTVGKGKKLFDGGSSAGNWKLIRSEIASTGVVMATYEPAGELKVGSFEFQPPSEEELARRKRFAREQ